MYIKKNFFLVSKLTFANYLKINKLKILQILKFANSFLNSFALKSSKNTLKIKKI